MKAVFLTTDQNFVNHAYNTIQSVKRFGIPNHAVVDVILFTNDPNLDFPTEIGCNIVYLDWKLPPRSGTTDANHESIVTLRLAALDWLNKNGYTDVIHLDADLLVQKSIMPIFDLPGDFNAARDNQNMVGFSNLYDFWYTQNKYYEALLRRKSWDHYFNAGVFRIRLSKFRHIEFANSYLDFRVKTPKVMMQYYDQDFLNIWVWNIERVNFHFLPPKFNCMPDSNCVNPSPEMQRNSQRNAAIIHYVGPFKPWCEKFEEHKEYVSLGVYNTIIDKIYN